MPEQGAKAYMTELIARVILGYTDIHHDISIDFGPDNLELIREGDHIQVSALVYDSGHRGSTSRWRWHVHNIPREITDARHVANQVVAHYEPQFIHFDGNWSYLTIPETNFHLFDVLHPRDVIHSYIDDVGVVEFTIHNINWRTGQHVIRRFKDVVDPEPYILPGDTYSPGSNRTSSSSGSNRTSSSSRNQSSNQSRSGSNGWEPTPSYSYNPPHVARSAFGNPSKIKSGHSFAFTSSDFTGSGTKPKLRNALTRTELENTANSGGYNKNPVVYAHTSEHNATNPLKRKNTGRDPARAYGQYESWKHLGGQRNPFTREEHGHQNLRKIPEAHVQAAVAHELKKRRAKKRKVV